MEITREIPENFEATYEDGFLEVEGNGDSTGKQLEHARVQIDVEDGEVIFSTESTKRDVQSIVKAFASHLENLVDGLQNPHVYKMKGVYAHFPMTVKHEGNEVVIENFMGERNPRRAEIMEGVDVEVDGDDLTLTGPNKEHVSQTAARIEQICKKGDRDPRTFQDGVYITEVEDNE